MLGIGIIGAGFFGENHARAILETHGTELIAASRRNTEELQKFSRKFDIIGYTDYKELIKNPDINAVIIAVPHQEHTREAAPHGRLAGGVHQEARRLQVHEPEQHEGEEAHLPHDQKGDDSRHFVACKRAHTSAHGRDHISR